MATTATPTETTTITSNIPDWAKAAAQKQLGMLYNTTGAIDPSTGQPYLGLAEQGYQQYQGPMLAGFNPLQQQAFEDIAKMGVSPQTMQATGLAGLAGLQAQTAGQYDPYAGKQNFYDYRAKSFNQPGVAGSYMSPYMQNVVNQQKQQAVQDYARQLPTLAAGGIRAGAQGGTRQALMEAEGRRNLNQQLQGIQAQGTQQAYAQGQQQFNTEQAARQQAAAARAQYGLQGAQLGESSRQFGANLGMEGLRQQLAAAGVLGGLGQQQYQQGLGINAAQLGAGAQIQALAQQDLANRYQNFINQQQFPYKQMEFASGILRGIPSTGVTQTLYQAPGSTIGQIAGLATGLGGLFGSSMFGTPTTGTSK